MWAYIIIIIIIIIILLLLFLLLLLLLLYCITSKEFTWCYHIEDAAAGQFAEIKEKKEENENTEIPGKLKVQIAHGPK